MLLISDYILLSPKTCLSAPSLMTERSVLLFWLSVLLVLGVSVSAFTFLLLQIMFGS